VASAPGEQQRLRLTRLHTFKIILLERRKPRLVGDEGTKLPAELIGSEGKPSASVSISQGTVSVDRIGSSHGVQLDEWNSNGCA
jgi:hypothetical protein